MGSSQAWPVFQRLYDQIVENQKAAQPPQRPSQTPKQDTYGNGFLQEQLPEGLEEEEGLQLDFWGQAMQGSLSEVHGLPPQLGASLGAAAERLYLGEPEVSIQVPTSAAEAVMSDTCPVGDSTDHQVDPLGYALMGAVDDLGLQIVDADPVASALSLSVEDAEALERYILSPQAAQDQDLTQVLTEEDIQAMAREDQAAALAAAELGPGILNAHNLLAGLFADETDDAMRDLIAIREDISFDSPMVSLLGKYLSAVLGEFLKGIASATLPGVAGKLIGEVVKTATKDVMAALLSEVSSLVEDSAGGPLSESQIHELGKLSKGAFRHQLYAISDRLASMGSEGIHAYSQHIQATATSTSAFQSRIRAGFCQMMLNLGAESSRQPADMPATAYSYWRSGEQVAPQYTTTLILGEDQGLRAVRLPETLDGDSKEAALTTPGFLHGVPLQVQTPDGTVRFQVCAGGWELYRISSLDRHFWEVTVKRWLPDERYQQWLRDLGLGESRVMETQSDRYCPEVGRDTKITAEAALALTRALIGSPSQSIRSRAGG